MKPGNAGGAKGSGLGERVGETWPAYVMAGLKYIKNKGFT